MADNHTLCPITENVLSIGDMIRKLRFRTSIWAPITDAIRLVSPQGYVFGNMDAHCTAVTLRLQ